jgi:hypothetical protein
MGILEGLMILGKIDGIKLGTLDRELLGNVEPEGCPDGSVETIIEGTAVGGCSLDGTEIVCHS